MPKERLLKSTFLTWKNPDTKKTSKHSTIGSVIQKVLQIASSRNNMVPTLFIKFGDHHTSIKRNNKSKLKVREKLRNNQLVNHGP